MAMSARHGISTILGQELQKVNKFLCQYSVRSEEVFSTCCSTGVFIRIANGYYHSEYFSRSLRRPLSLPILGL